MSNNVDAVNEMSFFLKAYHSKLLLMWK